MYEYKMVEVPRDLRVVGAGKGVGVAASMIEKIANDWSAKGWEFYRIDTLSITESPGCLDGLQGKKEASQALGVITFRRLQRNENQA